MKSLTKECLLFLAILATVLIVNIPIISFNFTYPEQPSIYLANQQISNSKDLLNIYLHPKLFQLAIPFFRPSGHFLIYQILTPFFGWHNNRAFIIVNLIFLALTSYLIIKLYPLLFPNLKKGGWIAAGFYIMQPALILSRLIVLHFEFAYVFFIMLSLYSFVIFCQKNLENYFLGLTIAFYIIAVTFKEAALMLGPVLICYFCIYFYKKPFSKFIQAVLKNKSMREIIFLLVTVTVTLTIYLTLPWPTFLENPLHGKLMLHDMGIAVLDYLRALLSMNKYYMSFPALIYGGVIFPFGSRMLNWALLAVTIFMVIKISQEKMINPLYKKSLIFLSTASLLFMFFPILWAAGLAWHLSVTLIFLSMIMGFSCEYVMQAISNAYSQGVYIFLLIALVFAAINVNDANVRYYKANYYLYAPSELNKNAILFPPNIQSQLNSASIVLVEDRNLPPYLLGNSYFPLYSLNHMYAEHEKFDFLRFKPIYNGTLFRVAYLMPKLKEEIFPFQVQHMDQVINQAIYNWLLNQNNIFCLGYDDQQNWHDKTLIFKKNLLLEKIRRRLIVNTYRSIAKTALHGHILFAHDLAYADPEICQFHCDQNKKCRGFTYIDYQSGSHKIMQCQLYSKLYVDKKACVFCEGFIKT